MKPDNRTGLQRRADLRAEVSDALSAALRDCDRSARAVWAATLDVSTTHLDNCVNGTKALHIADALAAPELVRHALARMLVGEGYAVVALPDATEAADDWNLAADAAERTSQAVAKYTRSIADGVITAKESGEGEPLIKAAVSSLLGIGLRFAAASRERVVGIRSRAGAR